MKTYLDKLKKNEFVRNVLVLMTGTGLAQVIPLLIAPVLSRLYTPDQFGTLALFLSVVQILGCVINLRYELAIVLPKDKRDSLILVYLSLLIAFLLSCILLFIVLLFKDRISIFLNDPSIADWLYFLPLSIFLTGVYNALTYYNTRNKKFKILAQSNVVRSFTNSLIQVVLGFFKWISGGLILGQIISMFFGNTRMLKDLLKEKKTIKSIKYLELKRLAKRYSDFPKYSTLGIFLNMGSINIVNIFINKLYSNYELGLYSYGFRYLSLPSTLIGNSIGQVYMQKISGEISEGQTIKKTFISALQKLSLIGVFIFGVMYFIVEDAFAIIFGEEWRVAGVYAKITMPLIFVRFIASPLSITAIIFEKQKKYLVWQFILFLFTVIGILLVYIFSITIEYYLWLNTLISSLCYIMLLFWLYRLCNNQFNNTRIGD